jgi:hypothetical protein
MSLTPSPAPTGVATLWYDSLTPTFAPTLASSWPSTPSPTLCAVGAAEAYERFWDRIPEAVGLAILALFLLWNLWMVWLIDRFHKHRENPPDAVFCLVMIGFVGPLVVGGGTFLKVRGALCLAFVLPCVLGCTLRCCCCGDEDDALPTTTTTTTTLPSDRRVSVPAPRLVSPPPPPARNYERPASVAPPVHGRQRVLVPLPPRTARVTARATWTSKLICKLVLPPIDEEVQLTGGGDLQQQQMRDELSYRTSHPKTDIVLPTREVCEICLDDFSVGDEIAWSHNAACHHVFHQDCLLDWLEQGTSNDCPVCRRPI